MFRLSHYVSELSSPQTFSSAKPIAPVVIWNLLRKCNLACKHCYANSYFQDFEGELSLNECYKTIDDLKEAKVFALILSGGEPLLHPHIFDIASYAKSKKFYLALSSNGILITKEIAQKLKEINFNYVGVSLDGLGETHDQIRGEVGAFNKSIEGIKNGVAQGLKMGVRMTLTHSNYHQIEELLELCVSLGVEKFYLSHLNYGGRGNKKEDAHFKMTREVMTFLFNKALELHQNNIPLEIVTGNNDADAVFMYQWTQGKFEEEKREHLRTLLNAWGGNASGIGVANIDSQGDVHPDTFWPGVKLGNIREKSFSEIWNDNDHPILKILRSDRKALKGRCHDCHFLKICNGNTRVRAQKMFNDPWESDPGCYLTDQEIFSENNLLNQSLVENDCLL